MKTDSNPIAVFGELLLRFSSDRPEFMDARHQVNLFPGGSEANVAASLGQFGLDVRYLSAVPDNQLAAQTLGQLERLGADTSRCVQRGDRLGLYFLLSANGLTKGEVVYDRKYSSFSELHPGELDWNELLRGCSWFHWTALSPALNDRSAEVLKEGLEVAANMNIPVSVDLNYRSKLWNYGKKPVEVMPELAKYCQVIMGNIWAANTLLGIPVDENLNRETSKEVYFKHAIQSAKQLREAFPACEHVAYTFRFMDNPSHNLFYGTYHHGTEDVISETMETFELVDRIGSGDAFMAGLILALKTKQDAQERVDLATRAGFKKLFVKGDFGNGTH